MPGAPTTMPSQRQSARSLFTMMLFVTTWPQKTNFSSGASPTIHV